MPGNALAPRLVDQHGCVARGLRLAILQDGEEIELACELAALSRVRAEIDGNRSRAQHPKGGHQNDRLAAVAEGDRDPRPWLDAICPLFSRRASSAHEKLVVSQADPRRNHRRTAFPPVGKACKDVGQPDCVQGDSLDYIGTLGD